MIDIHAHILPGVDDGPSTIEASIDLAKEAVQNGITVLIATPHHKNGVYVNEGYEVVRNVRKLQDILDDRLIPLTLEAAQEIHVYDNILNDIQADNLLTLDPKQKYILLELPHDHVPRVMEQLIYEIQMLGITPIIPHPERNIAIRKQPNLLYQLVKKGALAQLTAASIIGKFGSEIQKFSYQCIEHNLCHLIASDAHRANKRGIHMLDAYADLQIQYGHAYVSRLKENAEKVYLGHDIYCEPPIRIENKKNIFSLFKRS